MLLGAWEQSGEALHSVEAVLNNVIKGWVQPQLWVIMVCLLLALPGRAFEAEELSVWMAAFEPESPPPIAFDPNKAVLFKAGWQGKRAQMWKQLPGKGGIEIPQLALIPWMKLGQPCSCTSNWMSWQQLQESQAMCLNTASLSPVWWGATRWPSPGEGCITYGKTLPESFPWGWLEQKGRKLEPFQGLWLFALISVTCFRKQNTQAPFFEKRISAQVWINFLPNLSTHLCRGSLQVLVHTLESCKGPNSPLLFLLKRDLLVMMFPMSLVQLLTFSLLPVVL